MTRPLGLALLLTCTVGAPALAQTPAAEAPSPAPPAAPAASDADERIRALEARLSALESARAQPAAPPAKPSPLKWSGYIQGRYEWHDDANYGLDPRTLQPRGTSRFLVRRARLKATYTSTNAEYVLQLSSSRSEGFQISDAEATFIDTWTPFGVRLTVGQFKVPFGFELLQSSSEREMPERSRMVREFFPGERDRGLRLKAGYGIVSLQAALINGTGVQDARYQHFDQTSWKDVVGRLGFTTVHASGGVSGYYGHTLVTTVANSVASYSRFRRIRLGADAQGMVPLPVGPFVLRAELIWNDDHNLSFGADPRDACGDARAYGWYVTAVQRLGTYAGLVARVDQYDPLADVRSGCGRDASASGDRTTTFGGGAMFFIDPHLRLTVTYDHVREQNRQQGNDVLFTQLQAKF